jgi:transposase
VARHNFGPRHYARYADAGSWTGDSSEAVTRPTMRFVGVKTIEQQSIEMLHRVRLILMRQRTQLSNALRSHLAEFGIVSAIGRVGLDRLLTIVADTDDGRVPSEAALSHQPFLLLTTCHG